MTELAGDGRDKIAAARLRLVSEDAANLPYLAHALYALTPVAATEVERIAVDEQWRVYLNPAWLTDVSVPELARQLLHVTWHLLHDHAARARDLRVDASTAECWHRAADAALCETLAAEGRLPEGVLSPAELELPAGRTAEEYFAVLSGLPATAPDDEPVGSTEQHQGCGSGCDGLLRSHELPPDADASGFGGVDKDEAEQIRRRVAIDYLGAVTGRGDQPGDALRWARQLVDPTIPWEPLLASAVRRAVAWTHGHTEHTYRRPSRRQSAVPGVVLPGTRRPLPAVALVIDTSASIDDALLGRALSEVDGALAALGVVDSQVTVLSCDAAVQTVGRVRAAAQVRLAGGGGTDMRIGLAATTKLRPRPELVVVLTDGYTPWPAEPPPGSAVVAAMLGRSGDPIPPTPDWARRVECLLN